MAGIRHKDYDNTQGFIIITNQRFYFEDIVQEYGIPYARYDSYGESVDSGHRNETAFRIRTTRPEAYVLIEDFKKNYPDATIICFKN